MKKIIPHIFIDNCKDVIEYYQEVFKGEIKNTQSSDGMEIFKGHEGKYIHAELHLTENCILYFADTFGNVTNGDNIVLCLDLDSEEEISQLYNKLQKDGQVKMELQTTFWNSRYAVVVDKFGIKWELNFTLGN